MSHFTRVLPSISPRININHPTLTNPPLLHTNNPFVSTLPPINTDAERSAGENAFTDGRMSVTTPYLFLPPPPFFYVSFCPSGFTVQTAAQDLIVPNHR